MLDEWQAEQRRHRIYQLAKDILAAIMLVIFMIILFGGAWAIQTDVRQSDVDRYEVGR